MTDANQKKFEVVTAAEMDKKNAWYSDCRSREVPYVVVTTYGQKAMVQWDYFSFDPGPKEDVVFAKSRELADAQLAMYKRHESPGSEEAIRGTHSDFYNLPLANAMALAEELYDYLFAEICGDDEVESGSPASEPVSLAIALYAVLFEAKALGLDIDAICDAAAGGMVDGSKPYRSGSANLVVPATDAIRSAQKAAKAS